MKKLMLLPVCVLILKTQGQISDSITKLNNNKRNEIGLNILPPVLVLSGVTKANPQLFNITHRYFFSEKLCFRSTFGVYVFNNKNEDQIMVSKTNSTSINLNNYSSYPANFQGGLGLEYIFGKHKLKQSIGFDLTYNYVNIRTHQNYFMLTDTVTATNEKFQTYKQIDTGAKVINTFLHKYGITTFYSLRYPISKRLIVSSGIRLNTQYYQNKIGNRKFDQYDFNISGILSEVSLFYRF